MSVAEVHVIHSTACRSSAYVWTHQLASTTGNVDARIIVQRLLRRPIPLQ